MDLAHGLELVGTSLTSSNGGDVSFDRTLLRMDDGDYDGATYTLRITAVNDDGSAREVRLKDSGGTTYATIDVEAGAGSTTVPKFFESTSFTPGSGATDYLIEIEQTTNNSDLDVYSAQIWISQTSATKTRLCYAMAYKSLPSVVDEEIQSTTSSTFDQPGEPVWRWFLKEESEYGDTIGDWALEVTGRNILLADEIEVQLHNRTDDTQVAVTGTFGSGTTDYLRAEVAVTNGATNFDDGDEFDIQFRQQGGGRAELGAARLYVKVTSLSAALVYMTVHAQQNNINADDRNGYLRALYASGDYDTVTLDWEVRGQLDSGTSFDVELFEADDAEATTGSTVAGSGITIDTALPGERTRATGLTVSDSHLIANIVESGTSQIDIATATLIIHATGTPTPSTTGSIGAQVIDSPVAVRYNFVSHSVPGEVV